MPQMPERDIVVLRDASLIFKNFKGAQKKYNVEGNRNFSLMFGEEDAQEMIANGWNVKPLRRQEEDDQQMFHLPVSVAFEYKPPRCWLVTNAGTQRTLLGESLISMFDDLESLRVDVTISGYDWEVSGKKGKKAYLRSMFFHMYEDELEREYADVQQLSAAGDGAAGSAMAAIESGLSNDLGPRQPYDYEGEEVR